LGALRKIKRSLGGHSRRFFIKIRQSWFLEDEFGQIKLKYYLYFDDVKYKIKSYKRAIRGKEANEDYFEFRFIREMGWTPKDLYEIPEEEFIKYMRLWLLEEKERVRNERLNNQNQR